MRDSNRVCLLLIFIFALSRAQAHTHVRLVMFVFHDLYILEFHHTLHKTIPFCFSVYFLRYCRCHCISNYRVLCFSLNRSLFCPLCHGSQTRITIFFCIKWFEFDLNATMRHKPFDRWIRRRFTYCSVRIGFGADDADDRQLVLLMRCNRECISH